MLNRILNSFFVNIICILILKFIYSDVYEKSVEQVFAKLGFKPNTKLHTLLIALLPNLGPDPNNLPFTLYASMMKGYYDEGNNLI